MELQAHIRAKIDDPSLRVPDLADAVYMSESSLLRKLKTLVGITPSQYIQELRLDYAREILENNSHYFINQVTAMAGYAETGTFSRSYFKRFGKKPSDY